MLRARGSKGVMAVVENLSNRQLDEPEFHARCRHNQAINISNGKTDASMLPFALGSHGSLRTGKALAFRCALSVS